MKNIHKMFLSVIAFSLFIMLISTGLVQAKTNKPDIAPNRVKFYKSIEIQSGDTLSTIAEAYISDEYSSIKEYVKEVQELNELKTDTIYSGRYLIVPYYMTVD